MSSSLLSSSSFVLHAKQVSTPSAVFALACQSLGVVYGDIGTSPLYVYSSIFASKTPTKEDVLGAMSLIFWTITLVVLIEYLFVVLSADDNGEGGTFALYSLICRKANINIHGHTAAEDQRLSTYGSGLATTSIPYVTDTPKSVADTVIRALRKKRWARGLLTFTVLLTSSMVLGDGVLTPAISGAVVGITCAILIVLFLGQRFGTAKVGASFSPIIFVWFMSNICIAAYNINKYDRGIFRAVSPHYAASFFRNNGREGFLMLGGVFLCITGAEAMYADMGHFTKVPIQLSFSLVVYPSLILTYLGQTAWLTHHLEDVSNTFYSSIPTPVFWPMLVLATLASIVAGQAVISAAFSLIRQSIALGYFPRLSIVHTSPLVEGQIYIPEVCWTMMILTVAVVAGFQDTTSLGNAYGIAVCLVMISTVAMLSIVMVVVWNVNVPWTLLYTGTYGSLFLIFLVPLMRKVPEGGWFALTVGAAVTCITATWCIGSYTKTAHLAQHKVSKDSLLTVEPPSVDADGNETQGAVISKLSGKPLVRLPGLALLYTEKAHGLPLVFVELVKRLGIMHDLVVFVTVRRVPVPAVPETERVLFQAADLPGAFRCVMRYGYMEQIDHGEAFVALVLHHIKATASAALSNITTSSTTESSDSGAGLVTLSRPMSLPLADLQRASRLLQTMSARHAMTTVDGLPVSAHVRDLEPIPSQVRASTALPQPLQATAAAPQTRLTDNSSPRASRMELSSRQVVNQGPADAIAIQMPVPEESRPSVVFPDIAVGVPGLGVMVQGSVSVGDQPLMLNHPVQYIFLNPSMCPSPTTPILSMFLLDLYNKIKRNAQKPYQRWKIPTEGLVEFGIVMNV